jgi:osmotically-inducible protein OsmY
MLPWRPRGGADKDAFQTSTRLLEQSLEDLHLAERVERALRATGYGPLRGIEVVAHVRVVTLAGRVPSYYLKQVAQAIALSVPGVDQVRNDLEVGRPELTPPGGTRHATS